MSVDQLSLLILVVVLGLGLIALGVSAEVNRGTPSCWHVFQSGDFCTDCGVSLKTYCDSCDAVVDGDYCSVCGSPVN